MYAQSSLINIRCELWLQLHYAIGSFEGFVLLGAELFHYFPKKCSAAGHFRVIR